MLTKRSWFLIGITLILLLGAGLAIISCNIFGNQSHKQAAALGLTPSEFATLDTSVRECFIEEFAFLQDYPDFPIYYERVSELEDKPGLTVIKAYGRFQLPSPSVTFGFYGGKTYLIETEFNPASDS